ncbi:hypothetical protein KIF59_05535 [Enterobacter cloacae subsp. cloacae]|nr:hypothetical protein [Enterobacter cloacae subsp. cloacae]
MLTFVWFFTGRCLREEWSEAALRAEEEKKKLTLGQSLNRLFVELSSTLRIKIFPSAPGHVPRRLHCAGRLQRRLYLLRCLC